MAFACPHSVVLVCLYSNTIGLLVSPTNLSHRGVDPEPDAMKINLAVYRFVVEERSVQCDPGSTVIFCYNSCHYLGTEDSVNCAKSWDAFALVNDLLRMPNFRGKTFPQSIPSRTIYISNSRMTSLANFFLFAQPCAPLGLNASAHLKTPSYIARMEHDRPVWRIAYSTR